MQSDTPTTDTTSTVRRKRYANAKKNVKKGLNIAFWTTIAQVVLEVVKVVVKH